MKTTNKYAVLEVDNERKESRKQLELVEKETTLRNTNPSPSKTWKALNPHVPVFVKPRPWGA